MSTIIIFAFAALWVVLLLGAGGAFNFRQLPLGLRSVRYLKCRPHHADTHRWSFQQLAWAMGLSFGTENAHLGPATRFNRDLKKIFRKRECCILGKDPNLPEVLVYFQVTSSEQWQRTALLRFTKLPWHPIYGVLAIFWFAHVIYPSGESLIVTCYGDVLTISELGEAAGSLLGVKLWKGIPATQRCKGILGDILALTGKQSAVDFCKTLLTEGTDSKNGRGLQLHLNF